MKPDELYVAARNKLIPQAERLAHQRDESFVAKARRDVSIPLEEVRSSLAREFSRAMTELAIEAGLVHEGMMKIFEAKKLPATFGATNGN